MDLQIRRDGNGVPLPVNLQPIESFNIEGFIPVIINMVPVNVPIFLGLSDESDSKNDLVYHDYGDPFDKLDRFEFGDA